MADRTESVGGTWRIANLWWGFPQEPEPRMGLVVLRGLRFRKARVWLEDDIGNRAFIVEGLLPPRIRYPLEDWVTANRDRIEDEWVQLMIAKGWLRIQTYGRTIEVVAYPGTPSVIHRTLDCSQCPVWIEDSDLMIRDGTLIVGVRNPPRAQVRHQLGRILWTGRDDGSDAGTIPF